FKNSDVYFNEAIQLIEKSKYKAGLLSLIYKIDADLILIGNYRKAIEYLFVLKKLSEKLEFHEQTSVIINSIGIIYWQQGNPNQALLLYSENLALIKRTGIKGDLAAAYNNIGLAYRQLNQLKRAVAFYTKSLQMCIANNDYRSQANAYNNLGTIYQLEGNYMKALYYHNKSLEIRMNVGDSIGISMSLGNMG
ncbi:MAG TPA: tetratricopeptide repeat protein, partial [Bacteroidia bacterium]|nr:tetratricopeptide repeat protein [Bacteroidia bacterium]